MLGCLELRTSNEEHGSCGGTIGLLSEREEKGEKKKNDEKKARRGPPFARNFEECPVPQKASALERKALVAQGAHESHPYCRPPFLLPVRHVSCVKELCRKIGIKGFGSGTEIAVCSQSRTSRACFVMSPA